MCCALDWESRGGAVEPTPRVPLSTPLSALRVLGVMAAGLERGWDAEVALTMAKRAAVFGVGGGKRHHHRG
jgi:anti-sigma factor RsiW